MITLLLLLTAGVIYVLWKQYSARPDEPPILPGSLPFVGHTLPLLRKMDSCNLWDWVSTIAEPGYAIGGVARVHIGPLTTYGVVDPDDAFTISNACLEKDQLYEFIKPLFGEGLFTSEASKWKNHRKLVSPSFSQIVLNQFMGIFNSQSRKLVDELDKETGQGYFDHGEYIRRNSLETIFLTTLREEMTDSSLKNKYIHGVESFLDGMIERVLKVWLHSSYTFRFSALKKEQDKILKMTNCVSDSIFQKRKAEFLENPNAERSIIPGTKFKTVLDLLVELSVEKGLMCEKDIRYHINTLIVAGYDTGSTVLLFTIILLGAHPEVQEKVFAECSKLDYIQTCTDPYHPLTAAMVKGWSHIHPRSRPPWTLLQSIREVIGDEDRDVTKQDLSRLVYLEAVIKESMRIYPIAPVAIRQLDKDVKLKNYTLVAGRTCFLFIHGLHRHPMWGPDRNVFRPERWLDPSQLPKTPYAFCPFSLGKRMCIGKAYAMMSLKVTFVHLVRHYRITGDDSKLRLKMDMMLKPVRGHFISIDRRK